MAVVATTGERIKQAMDARGFKRQAEVVKKSERFFAKYGRTLTKNALSQYINNKVEPKRDMIALIAETLNISDAWLLGYEVPMDREKPAPGEGDGLDDLDMKLISLFKQMTAEQKNLALALIEAQIKVQSGEKE